MDWKIIHIDETDSTNHWLKSHQLIANSPEPTAIWADYQTAGRGCGTNTWESERGKNLLFSLLIHPTDIYANEQFRITEAVSVALCQTLQSYLTQRVEIKWPNDIYVGDRKISGTLIECDLQGKTISNCIIGVGVNINQAVFRSDAPNPTSLQLLTGREHDRETILLSIINHFQTYYKQLESGGEEVLQLYMSHLYRREGMHRYRDVRGEFMAEMAGVEPTGHLLLRFENGNVVRYELKEVQFLRD